MNDPYENIGEALRGLSRTIIVEFCNIAIPALDWLAGKLDRLSKFFGGMDNE